MEPKQWGAERTKVVAAVKIRKTPDKSVGIAEQLLWLPGHWRRVKTISDKSQLHSVLSTTEDNYFSLTLFYLSLTATIAKGNSVL